MQGTAYQVDKGPILEIPIYKPEEKYQLLVSRIVAIIIWAKGNNDKISTHILENVINALIFELYFPDHLKERKIDVLKFVEKDEKDIKEVMQGKEFESLSDSKKKQVIAELHKRWCDPNSEIVKRMNSFAEKSPDILKPILEG